MNLEQLLSTSCKFKVSSSLISTPHQINPKNQFYQTNDETPNYLSIRSKCLKEIKERNKQTKKRTVDLICPGFIAE
ncbi:hypothetical protein HanRHA438_Chr14g0639671 [Helianthus annuus]|nr:hypothetical protein HanRHA438_Chr14g0639671 [Helianthus annuus]